MAYYQKRVNLLRLIGKMKLWPSRKGMLHGIRSIETCGERARIITHCNKMFDVVDSKNSRAARWLRNKLAWRYCPECHIPGWKIEKYSETSFSKHHGSALLEVEK